MTTGAEVTCVSLPTRALLRPLGVLFGQFDPMGLTDLTEPLSALRFPGAVQGAFPRRPGRITVQGSHVSFPPTPFLWFFVQTMKTPVFANSADGSEPSLFVQLRNTEDRDAFFTPPAEHGKGHMLQIIVPEEHPLQVVDDGVDGPVGGVPHVGVVRPPGGDDGDLHHRPSEMRKRFLPCRLGNGGVDHGLPGSSSASDIRFMEGRGSWSVSVTTRPVFLPSLWDGARRSCPAVGKKVSKS